MLQGIMQIHFSREKAYLSPSSISKWWFGLIVHLKIACSVRLPEEEQIALGLPKWDQCACQIIQLCKAVLSWLFFEGDNSSLSVAIFILGFHHPKQCCNDGFFGSLARKMYNNGLNFDKKVPENENHKVQKHMGSSGSKFWSGLHCNVFLALKRLLIRLCGLVQMWRYEGVKTLAHYLKRKDCIEQLAADLEVPYDCAVPTVMKQIFECLGVRVF